jgi:phospholipid transport system transporter-binding protein
MQLPRSLTIETAAAWSPPAPGAAADPLVVDASPLVEFDSAALAVLLQARRQADAAGRGFQVLGVPPKLAQLAHLYGVDGLLNLTGAQGAAA